MSNKWENIPKSTRMIYELLQCSRELMDAPTIQSKVDYSMKTTRTGLKLLAELGIIEKKYSLLDVRKTYYRVKEQLADKRDELVTV
ncbi:MAG: hypothetical protein ACFFD4_22575 [Candidatus Odinarchaeota archaeon]